MSKADVATVSSLAGSDTEQSSKPVADPSNPLCDQLPSDLPADSPTDSGTDLLPTIALSLCGGLGDSRQISHGRWEGRGKSAVLKSINALVS